MATAEQLEVRRDGVVVATLGRVRQSPTTLWLRYEPAVLDTVPTGSPLVSCSLPVRSGRLDATAWARGLLPEGQHLLTLAAAADLAASDTFALLARYGRDIAGAFEITADDPPARQPAVAPYGPGELDVEIARLDTAPLGIHDDSELSLAGLQDKLVAVRTADGWGRPVHGYPSTHIIKIDPARHPGLVDAEAAGLRLARAVGLSSVEVERARLGGHEAIIVSRFDRMTREGSVHRLHQEDLLQALGVHPDGAHGRAKYQPAQSPGPPSWWHAADLLDSHAAEPTAQLVELARVVTFTTALANADCHAKNVAFLLVDGRITLAPLYDTVPTALWPGLRTTAALAVNDVVDMAAITVDDIVAEAGRWRLANAHARAAVRDTLELLLTHVDAAGHERVAELVTANARRLLAG